MSWWLQCNMVVNAASPLAGYAAVSNLLNAAGPGANCLDISYTDMIASLANTSLQAPAAGGGRQWTYQTYVGAAMSATLRACCLLHLSSSCGSSCGRWCGCCCSRF